MDAQIQFPNGTPMRDGVLRRLMEGYPPKREETIVMCRLPWKTYGHICTNRVVAGERFCERHTP